MFNPQKSTLLWLTVVVAVAMVVDAATSCVEAVFGCSNSTVMTACLTPIHVRDDRGVVHTVPCGRCNACLVRARAEWVARLKWEQRSAASSFFITLTYDNEHLPIREYVDETSGVIAYAGVVSKDDVVKFNKRFRKILDKKYKTKVRFYLISEYGPTTLRPHYHACYFLDSVLDSDSVHSAAVAAWPFCNPIRLTVGPVLDERIKYVTEYCLTKNGIPDFLEPNFRLCSRNPGLGAAYVDKFKDWHLADKYNRFYVPQPDGDKCNLPRYYRDKIYDHASIIARSRTLEDEAFAKEQAMFAEAGFDEKKYYRDRRAAIQDYNRRTNRFLNKKSKKI